MDCDPEMHVKMCKKIAQLTKVREACQQAGCALGAPLVRRECGRAQGRTRPKPGGNFVSEATLEGKRS